MFRWRVLCYVDHAWALVAPLGERVVCSATDGSGVLDSDVGDDESPEIPAARAEEFAKQTMIEACCDLIRKQ